jgi:branched-chain amino acid transport system substrate-binding protein
MKSKQKIHFLKSILVTVLAVILAVSFISCSTGSGDKDKGPVKIGLLVPYTGVFASNGYDITQGMELYFGETGWKAAGREIQLIKEDTEMNGQVGLQKARRLIEGEKIDILTGVVSSTVAYAIRDYVVSNKTPFIISNAGASDLTREKKSEYIFRVSFSNGQYEYPMGEYAYNTLKYKKIVVMAPDYAAGHEKAVGFMDGFKAAGGEIVQEIYPKLGTADYGPYLAQVKEADAVFAHFSGSDSLSFVKQYEEFGLKSKIPLLSTGDMVEESFLQSEGDAAIGIISCLHYSAALDTPENRKFYDSYYKKYNKEPNMFAEQGYVTAKVAVEALNKVEGTTDDTGKLLAAIKAVQFTAPRGPFKFHQQTQNVIFNTYIRKVEKIDGRLVNKVIDTIPETADYKTPVVVTDNSKPPDTKPCKVGLLLPFTGVFAQIGSDISQGFELYMDEVGWKAGGRQIQAVKEDSEGNGQVGLQKTRRLIESEKIDILTGVVNSAVAYAIKDYVAGSKIPFIIANAGASDLTRDNGSPYIFRVSFSNGQFEYPLGGYACKSLKYKKVVVMAADYAAGHEKAQGFMDGFRAAGGQIIQEIYPKLGTTDFAPYLAQIKAADAVWVYFVGNDSISFIKQYTEYGLKGKLPLLASGEFVDESVLPEQGEAALGVVTAHNYSAVLDIPENKKFAELYKAKFKEESNMGAVQGYIAARVIVEALNDTGGDGSDTGKLLAAIGKVNFNSPRGPFKFDPVTRNTIFNVYIRKVEKTDGKYVNSVMAAIPDVADYWTPKK